MKIVVKNISQVFNRNSPLEFKAISNASCVIKQGEYIAIIGETGSGKTTFIEHLNSLLIPTTGSINWVFEHTFRTKKQEIKTIQNLTIFRQRFRQRFKKNKIIRQHVGVVFQFAEYQLFESTIERDIMFGPMAFGVKKEEAKLRAAKYIEQVGLPLDYLQKNPLALSGGQKRRVALAGILAIEPDILILDEPTAGLDPAGVREILDIFDRLHKNGKTIIMVTHDMNNVLERTNRTIVFSNGTIIKDSETFEVLNDDNFVHTNNLITPQVIDLLHRIQKQYPHLKIPKITSLQQLTSFLNSLIKKKKGATSA